MQQANVSRPTAFRALKKNANDIIAAIVDLQTIAAQRKVEAEKKTAARVAQDKIRIAEAARLAAAKQAKAKATAEPALPNWTVEYSDNDCKVFYNRAKHPKVTASTYIEMLQAELAVLSQTSPSPAIAAL